MDVDENFLIRDTVFGFYYGLREEQLWRILIENEHTQISVLQIGLTMQIHKYE